MAQYYVFLLFVKTEILLRLLLNMTQKIQMVALC